MQSSADDIGFVDSSDVVFTLPEFELPEEAANMWTAGQPLPEVCV